MFEGLNQNLPETLRAVRTRPLFVMRLDVAHILDVGETPGATRRIGLVTGGVFKGERLSGEVLSGNDWQALRHDGSTALDVRLILKIDDGTRLAMTYQGLRHGPPDVIARMNRGEAVDPADYYFRINPRFEIASAAHAWLNDILAIGIGHRTPAGPIYSIFEVL